jgi:nucleoid-associated protein YgaU
VLLGSRGGRIRCLAVWTAATAGLGPVAAVARARLAGADLTVVAVRRTPLDVALTEIAALALLGCALWMWAATTAVVVDVLRDSRTPGSGRSARGVPAGVRRVVLAACGVALAGGLAQPSYAAGPHVHGAATLSGLPLPDRAVAGSAHMRRTVRVRPGDTLWSLAARDLPVDSPDASITARWHAIYAANRSLIGPDPDVIEPGLRLRLPGKDPT